MADTAIRIVLVESQRLIRDALHSVLQGSGNLVVVGETPDADGLLDVVDAQHPDVVLVVLDGWGERESALLQELHRLSEQARTLVITSESDTNLNARAIELGAMGIVPKTHSAQLLIKAVHKVQAGELWLDRAQTAEIVNRLTRVRPEEDPETVKIANLTPRERQIVTLVSEGLKNKDIAERLFISEATARNHVTSILDKLGLSNRFQLAVYAFRKGLVFCPQTPAVLRHSQGRRTETHSDHLVGVSRTHSS